MRWGRKCQDPVLEIGHGGSTWQMPLAHVRRRVASCGGEADQIKERCCLGKEWTEVNILREDQQNCKHNGKSSHLLC